MPKRANFGKALLVATLVIVASLAIYSEITLARAGGGSGGHVSRGGGSFSGGGGFSSGGRSYYRSGYYTGGYGGIQTGSGGINSSYILPAVIVFGMFGVVILMGTGAIPAALAYIKSKRCKYLITEHLASQNPRWYSDVIQSTVEKVFLVVQLAWTNRDYSDAQKYMSAKLYQEHQAKIDRMLAEHERNVLEEINLNKFRLVSVVSFGQQDFFWVQIDGSMIDYTIDVEDGYVLGGEPEFANRFTELWKFVLTPDGWVLDEICDDTPELRHELARGILVESAA